MTVSAESQVTESPPQRQRGPWRRGRVPRVSIYLLISLLMLALIAPAASFLGYILHRADQERQEEVARRGGDLAGDVADRLEIELRTLKTLLAVFATSGWLEEEQYGLLHQRARRALADSGRHLIVLDEHLGQLLNTRVPYGTPLGETSDTEHAGKVLDSGGVIVSDLFHGKVANAQVFNVLRRAVLPDGTRRVLILTRDAADLSRLFDTVSQPGNWSFAVLDGSGNPAFSRMAADRPDDAMPEACREEVFGFRTSGRDEGAQFVFRRTLDGAPWRICVWGSANRLLESAGPFWNMFMTATVVWFVAALAAVIGLSTAISRSIAETAAAVESLEASKPVSLKPSFITEVDEVRQALTAAAAERLRKERDQQLLLRETAHRAKNQMSLAVSLINLSSHSAADVASLRDDVSARLSAVGRSIEVMTGRQAEAAPMRRLVRVQLDPFLDDGSDRLAVSGEEVLVSQSAAQSLSLILHELATNASKYGAWALPDGRVEIAWRVDADNLVLDWAESDGGGAAPARKGFGTTLVDSLVEGRFRGTIERDYSGSGFSCRIVMPLEAVTPPPEDDGSEG